MGTLTADRKKTGVEMNESFLEDFKRWRRNKQWPLGGGAQFYRTSLNVLHVDEKEPSGVCSWSRIHFLAHPNSLKSAPLFVPPWSPGGNQFKNGNKVPLSLISLGYRAFERDMEPAASSPSLDFDGGHTSLFF